MTDSSSSSHNVVLIGFMGTGKTSIGRRVASSMGFKFIDTDDLIVESEGRTIADIFSAEGEDFFRDLETQMLESCARLQNQVFATGGGIVLREENRQLLSGAGYVIWLKSSAADILERVSRNRDRPLLQTADPLQTVENLLNEREELYASCSDFTIDTTGLTLDETAFGICESAGIIFDD